ncbi:MAG: response regulator [Chloroflexi bacterium]|nr:response regulator [Chloroflexota bacterium]
MNERHRVLVVEDDDLIRSVLEAALEDEGYLVRTAPHGRAALAVLERQPIDVVLLDLMLPIMDGWTFLKERQQRGIRPAVPVAIVSASRTARDLDAAALGVAAVIPKPFDLDDLLAVVARLAAANGSAC